MAYTLFPFRPESHSTSSLTEPDMNELQKEMIQSIEYFAQISKIRVKDNKFIRDKINQISEQRVKFRKFAEESISLSLKMYCYAEDLIVFAECCEDDGISKEVLLKHLRSLLSDSKSYKSEATLLKKQIENITNSLSGIAKEISEYNEKITEERKALSNHIDTVDKITDDAKSYATRGKIVAGIGVIAAYIAIYSITPIAKVAFIWLSCFAIYKGAAIAGISTANAKTSSDTSIKLNYQLESVREEFSQHLRVMCNYLNNITNIIHYCESHWETQIVITENIINKLESSEKINKLIASNILTKAKKTLESSEGYSLNIRQVLNRDLMLT